MNDSRPDNLEPTPAGEFRSEAPPLANPHSKSGVRNSSRQSTISSVLAAVHCDRGAAAVPFMLCLPIFLMIVAVLVQYAILANGKSMVDYAAQVAARSATTALPDERKDAVFSAARLALVTLSPRSPDADPEGTAMEAALQTLGGNIPPTFAERYTYAMAATEIRFHTVDENGNRAPADDFDFLRHSGRILDVTLTYKMKLTVPGAMQLLKALPGFSSESVGGVEGKFFALVSTARVQTSHGRQAQTNGVGWPDDSYNPFDPGQP